MAEPGGNNAVYELSAEVIFKCVARMRYSNSRNNEERPTSKNRLMHMLKRYGYGEPNDIDAQVNRFLDALIGEGRVERMMDGQLIVTEEWYKKEHITPFPPLFHGRPINGALDDSTASIIASGSQPSPVAPDFSSFMKETPADAINAAPLLKKSSFPTQKPLYEGVAMAIYQLTDEVVLRTIAKLAWETGSGKEHPSVQKGTLIEWLSEHGYGRNIAALDVQVTRFLKQLIEHGQVARSDDGSIFVTCAANRRVFPWPPEFHGPLINGVAPPPQPPTTGSTSRTRDLKK